MSQHRFKSGNFEVLAGWDRPLRQFSSLLRRRVEETILFTAASLILMPLGCNRAVIIKPSWLNSVLLPRTDFG